MNTYEVITKAIEKYGKEAQTDVAIEELSELIQAIMKTRRAVTEAEKMRAQEHVTEEMADVQIMLNQLKIIFNNENKVADIISFKCNRLYQRMTEKNKERFVPEQERRDAFQKYCKGFVGCFGCPITSTLGKEGCYEQWLEKEVTGNG